MKNILKHLVLFLIGGLLYVGIELLWRGYSHWSMAIVGGVAFVLIGMINEHFTYLMPLWKQCGMAMVIITAIEFVTGLIVNLWLGWNIWNYTVLDVLGQISLPFMVVWYFLSMVGIILDDLCRHFLFKEKLEKYKLF